MWGRQAGSGNPGGAARFVRLGDMFRNGWAFEGDDGEWGMAAGLLDRYSALPSGSLLCGNGGGHDEWKEGLGKASAASLFWKRRVEGHL